MTTRRCLGALAALAALGGGPRARADQPAAAALDVPAGDDGVPPIKPDPLALAAAREANMQPTSVREGFAIGVALGPSAQFGLQIGDATGAGGGFDLRLGTVASPRWVWLAELAATTVLRAGVVNQSAVLTFGGQRYVKDALWLRAGAGFATFTRSGGAMELARFSGLGLLGAGGIDVFRRRGLALSTEVAATMARYRDGTVLGVALQLGASWY
ncbi:MAG: hypothetical protein R3B06_23630 [Kofleriaceae bacterium]